MGAWTELNASHPHMLNNYSIFPQLVVKRDFPFMILSYGIALSVAAGFPSLKSRVGMKHLLCYEVGKNDVKLQLRDNYVLIKQRDS